MRGAVMVRHVAVLGLDQHVAILVDENGGEGMIAVGQGTASDVERTPQEMLIKFRRTHVRNAVHGRPSPGSIMQTGDAASKQTQIRPPKVEPAEASFKSRI